MDEIYLHDVIIHKSNLSTDSGGVFFSKGIRIQAEHIEYSESHLEARGSVLIDLGKEIIRASELLYNLHEKEGVAKDAIFSSGIWLIHAPKVIFSEKRIIAQHPFLTPSTADSPIYGIQAESAQVENETVSIKSATFRFVDIPLLWFPSISTSLSKVPTTLLTYQISWISGQGPKLSFRYPLFSFPSTTVFARADIRSSRGFGGAIETETVDDRFSLLSRWYLAHDTFYRDTDPNQKRTRFRLQGALHAENINQQLSCQISWDKYSDKNLPIEFASDQFELGQPKRTEAVISAYTTLGTIDMLTRVNVNSFQGMKQEIPTLKWTTPPYKDPYLGIGFTSDMSIQYLEYSSAKDVEQYIPDYASGRLEWKPTLSRPFYLGPVELIPSLGGDIIGYTNSPVDQKQLQAFWFAGAKAQLPLHKSYEKLYHTVTPFASFDFVSHPEKSMDEIYIFGLNDGVHTLNEFSVGVQNWISATTIPLSATFSLSGLTFYNNSVDLPSFPYFLFEAELYYTGLHIGAEVIYNRAKSLFDEVNGSIGYTFSREASISLDVFHRSRFAYRRIDADNKFLLVDRTLDEILQTPLSDGRNLWVAKVQFPFHPLWTFRFQGHFGNGRIEKNYGEFQCDLITYISTHWRFTMSFFHTVRDDGFTVGLKLIK